MRHLNPTTTHADHTRATRLVLSWLDGDSLAFDVVLAEAGESPGGTMGLLCALADHTAQLGHQGAPDYADRLRASLLRTDDDAGRGTE